MVTPEYIKQRIAASLVCEYLEVEGDGAHFEAIIVCAAFEGKRLLARHQMVNHALGKEMGHEIHALSMKTLTPEQWMQEQAKAQG